MIWLKACPKCKNDLYEESDHFGRFVSCAQCGMSMDDAKSSVLADLAKREKQSAQSVPKPAVRRAVYFGR